MTPTQIKLEVALRESATWMQATTKAIEELRELLKQPKPTEATWRIYYMV